MCGIAGLFKYSGPENVATPVDVAAVSLMVSRLTHRGPDAGLVESYGSCTLGHRRLSVIDPLERSNQPMADPETGNAIVFNGEIYNFRELRTELEAQGHRFITNGDTEVVLHAYRLWGADCLTRLVGMFALAIWDAGSRKLLLARDRMGEKPLYYAITQGGITFASELSALTAGIGSGTLSPKGIREYLTHNYTLGETTIFSEIKRLEPAVVFIIDSNGKTETKPYWSLLDHYRGPRFDGTYEEAQEALSEKLRTAVTDCTVADVPLGALLSGGLDSAVVVGTLAQTMASPQNLSTFSIGFKETAFDERDLAAETAGWFGTSHHETVLDMDVEASFLKIVEMASEPLADTSSLPFYALSEFARQSVTVCLSGDGADELFAGYSTYQANQLRAWAKYLPVELLPLVAKIIPRQLQTRGRLDFTFVAERFAEACRSSPEKAHSSWRQIFKESEILNIATDDLQCEMSRENPFEEFERMFEMCADISAPLDRTLFVDAKTWLPCSVLPKVDRFSMAHNLEVRAPFLDYRVVEFAAQLPANWKLRGRKDKAILRDMAAERLHPQLSRRPKRGFNAPLRKWMKNQLYQLGRDATHSNKFKELFKLDRIDKFWDEHSRETYDHGFKLFGLTFLAVWLEMQPTSKHIAMQNKGAPS